MANLYPVILAGGSGTRLWPLSREHYPKQFLQLAGEDTLLQATVRRVRDAGLAAPMVVTGTDHQFLVQEQLEDKQLPLGHLVLEPTARNTAIAVAAAAEILLQQDAAAMLLVLPADHIIQNSSAWAAAVGRGIGAAAAGSLVTFGITPHFAATGYGYIAQGTELPGAAGAFAVSHFVEKPDEATAEGYVKSGQWLWNSGMFLMRADAYLQELEQFAPKILAAARAAVADSAKNENVIALQSAAYDTAPSRSIDHAVMEHTRRAAVVPCDVGWSDIGSWDALWDIAAKDENQNVVSGDVITHGTKNCYIRSERPLVATYGLQDAVVVATADVVMVSSRHQPQEIKSLIEKLRAAGRTELSETRRMHRPWGSYEVLMEGPGFKVKKITVKPGCRLSLQRHQHRSEHWVVVRGTAGIEIMMDGKPPVKIECTPNMSAAIPLGAMHRLSNPGEELLEIVEVQCGAYLGEDDIERFSDDYGRAA